jgi:hypothetical protein
MVEPPLDVFKIIVRQTDLTLCLAVADGECQPVGQILLGIVQVAP